MILWRRVCLLDGHQMRGQTLCAQPRLLQIQWWRSEWSLLWTDYRSMETETILQVKPRYKSQLIPCQAHMKGRADIVLTHGPFWVTFQVQWESWKWGAAAVSGLVLDNDRDKSRGPNHSLLEKRLLCIYASTLRCHTQAVSRYWIQSAIDYFAVIINILGLIPNLNLPRQRYFQRKSARICIGSSGDLLAAIPISSLISSARLRVQ